MTSVGPGSAPGLLHSATARASVSFARSATAHLPDNVIAAHREARALRRLELRLAVYRMLHLIR
jgi:hypothetical protein